MRALARGDLPLSSRLQSHLDLCLTCRNCERVCPAKVPYGRLIDNGRAFIQMQRVRPSPWHVLRRLTIDVVLPRPAVLRWLTKLLRAYQVSGLQRFLRATPVLRLLRLQRWDGLLPVISPQPAWQSVYPARGQSQGRVALFTGCVTASLDRQTLLATIQVLNALGYDVHVPQRQVCCGALYQHAGEVQKASALMRTNVQVFNAEQVDTIVSTASGCGAMLLEYPICLPEDAAARSFAGKIRDINHFVLQSQWPRNAMLAPLEVDVAVHTPCTLTNVLGHADSSLRLLERIPGLRPRALLENDFCCGAAGIYFLTQPDMANTLRARKLDALSQMRPSILATSNVGCALHLQHGIREKRLDIEVLHPIILVARQLGSTG
jgi:glycolate dehydrogenase iron-sulfur subunit